MMHPELAKMVPPSQKRDRIYRSGILQIRVTRACDLACFGCSEGSNLSGSSGTMTPGQFEEACASLSGYFGVVGVFGGNPAASKHFDDYCRIMRDHFPLEQRGLWCNRLLGKGAAARATYYAPHSNLNCHLSQEAYDEFARDWPESKPYLKGLHEDSVHSSPWVSPRDIGVPEAEHIKMIASCDINKWWSASILLIRGQLRGFFCEVAGAMASLHENSPDWAGSGGPMEDVGLPIEKNWWRRPMSDFADQVETCCMNCGIPMRRPGQLAITGDHEEFSETHEWIARPKVKGREIQVVKIGCSDTVVSDRPSTEYLAGVTPVRRA